MTTLKIKRLRFIIKIPIFHTEVLVMLGYSQDEAIKELTKLPDSIEFIKYITKLKSHWGACAIIRKDGCVLIWCPDLPNNPADKALFEHERRHAVEMLLDHRGVKFKLDVSDEVYTYTQQHLAQCIFEELDKYGL